MKAKKIKKTSIVAFLITSTVVSVGVGTTHIMKKVAKQKAKADELKQLKRLEDEEFEDFFE